MTRMLKAKNYASAIDIQDGSVVPATSERKVRHLGSTSIARSGIVAGVGRRVWFFSIMGIREEW